jgi:signal transduction histidine kinase
MVRRQGDAEAGAARLDRFGRRVLVGLIGVAILPTVVTGGASPLAPENLGIALLGLLFLAILLRTGEALDRWGRGRQALYFAVQLAVAAGAFALAARLGSFGMIWLLLMPLLAQGMLVWSWKGMVGLTAAVLVLPTLHVLALAGVRSALEVAAGMGVACAFVLLFSAVAAHEQRARARSERLGEELRAANRRLAELAVEAEELAAERERNRLAREIHDSVGHSLTVAHVQIEAARVHLGRRTEEADGALDKAGDAVRRSLTELRRSVAGLRSHPLGEGTLSEAVEALCREATGEGIATTFRVAGEPRGGLSPDLGLTLYRVAQEGLTNVRRHSAGSRAEVLLEYRPGAVVLVVRDDGPGPPAAADGFGLLGLRERVALHGGAFSAGPAEGAGFELAVEVPR